MGSIQIKPPLESRLAVLVIRLGELAVDLLEHDGRRPRRRELQLERAGGLDLALGLAQRVLELAGDGHLHLEHPRRVLLPELGLPGVAQRHRPALRARGQAVHHRLPGAQLLTLVGDLHALERLPVEGVRRHQRLVVLDADGPVRVADGQRHREVVRERRRRRRRAHQREAGEGRVLHGDPHVAEGPAEDDDDDDHAGEGHEAGGDGEEDEAALDVLADAVGDAAADGLAAAVAAATHGCFFSPRAAIVGAVAFLASDGM
jgi:hypothetical protein